MNLTSPPEMIPEPRLGIATPWAAGTLALSAWCVTAAFGTYFCMYGFRKPFTAGTYSGMAAWGVGYKTILVVSQVLGYTTSKFLGVRVIASMRPERRAGVLLGLIGLAQLALLLFALVPPPLGAAFLFLNGLPLGMVFGLVLGFLEGRRLTEAMTAALCASFILADGVTRSVGLSLLDRGVPESWMPFAAGLAFALPLLGFVWMLGRIPPPTLDDVARRGERVPMDRADRGAFFVRYAFGLTMIVGVYLLVTVLRGIRSDFAPEIWEGLGRVARPEDFARSETLVMLGVLATCGATAILRDNRRAFHAAMAVAMGGLGLVALSALGWRAGALDAFGFMVISGLGLYFPYVAVHTTIFERLMAMTRDRGNIGYLMYLADAFGYLGYAAVALGRGVVGGVDVLPFFLICLCVVALVASVLLAAGWIWFARVVTGVAGPGVEHDARRDRGGLRRAETPLRVPDVRPRRAGRGRGPGPGGRLHPLRERPPHV